jgi:hypothetical protein
VADCLERQEHDLEQWLRYITNKRQENRWPLGPDCEKYIDWLPKAPKNIEKYFYPPALSNDTTYNSTGDFNIALRNRRSAASLSSPGPEEQVTVISTLGFVTKVGITPVSASPMIAPRAVVHLKRMQSSIPRPWYGNKFFLVSGIVVVALLCLALWRLRKSQSLLPVITSIGLTGHLVIFLANVNNGPASSPVTFVLWLFTIVAVVGFCSTLWSLGTSRELITVLGSAFTIATTIMSLWGLSVGRRTYVSNAEWSASKAFLDSCRHLQVSILLHPWAPVVLRSCAEFHKHHVSRLRQIPGKEDHRSATKTWGDLVSRGANSASIEYIRDLYRTTRDMSGLL